VTDALDSEEDLPATCMTPESMLIRHSNINAVRCAIEQLPVIYREIILLCEVEDVSYRETADILSIPIGTVMSRLFRARTMVRESLLSTHGHYLRGDLSRLRTSRGGISLRCETPSLQSSRGGTGKMLRGNTAIAVK
jgi:predicted DNA-binding protein (UPF0251 family)